MYGDDYHKKHNMHLDTERVCMFQKSKVSIKLDYTSKAKLYFYKSTQ